VLGRELGEVPPEPEVEVRPARGEWYETWCDISVRAFFGDEAPAWATELGELMGGSAGSHPFLAFLDGVPVAAAVLAVAGDAAYLGGAATLPEARGRGAQGALLAARLRAAADLGVRAVVCEALPGSASERNQLRAGFQVLWSKAVLTPG
jgi:GNAT superfamily N-acetyltransferase